MKFILEISTDNAAFTDSPGIETARILREAADRIERGTNNSRLRDVNGNTVGGFEFSEDAPVCGF
jgi:hypothetical protein